MSEYFLTTQLGIDEAGRGSILGPLVMAGVVVNQETQKKLETYGIKDSKLFGSSLKAKKIRGQLAKRICRICPYKIITVAADNVDFYVENQSLNILEQEKAKTIISTLTADQVILDGLNLFKLLVDEKTSAINKADQEFISVAAASIIAKSERDRLFEKLIEPYFVEYGEVKGGGYANRATLKFVKWYLKNKKKLPPFYRKSYNWKYLQV